MDIKAVLTAFLLLIPVVSSAQSKEESEFFKAVSNKTIVPLELPHLSLEFSKNGHLFIMRSAYDSEAKLDFHFIKMDKDFAVYLTEVKGDKGYCVLKLIDSSVGFMLGESPEQAKQYFILTLGKYMQ